MDTPALCVDLPTLKKNIGIAAAYCRDRGVHLRPHFKTHKCTGIAKMQLAAGAIGISCATLDEAAALTRAGIRNVLLTSPLVGTSKLDRLGKLLTSAPDLLVVVDHPTHVTQLAELCAARGYKIKVLIDFDVGQRRTGANGLFAFEEVARCVSDCKPLSLCGLQAFAGQIQHIESLDERTVRAQAVVERMLAAVAVLKVLGVQYPIVSGSGTGTAEFDLSSGIFTELQLGSYVFLDADYEALEWRDGGDLTPSLFVMTTVISGNQKGFVTVDAGTKALVLGTRGSRVFTGPFCNAVYEPAGDEHGSVTPIGSTPMPPVGALLPLIPGHCDPTVNLYDKLVLFDGARVVGYLPVDGRRAGSYSNLHLSSETVCA
jgi:D-serine deaminase-like pyridoxal phosphate-dependent protein